MKTGDRVRVLNHRHPEHIGEETTIVQVNERGVVIPLKSNVPFGDPTDLWELDPKHLEVVSGEEDEYTTSS